ncbi:MAG: phosphoribosylglycinamide formyltransferase [Gammaproteobacteria bacterium]|nr:phosphoribosylglycinamide formyltransferase [Gammaproteobacteria bacterium]
MKLGVLASHGGTTLQAILDAISSGQLLAEVAILVSNNSRSGAMERALNHGLPTAHISGATHPDDDNRDKAIRNALQQCEVDLVVLSGYMKPLGSATLAAFDGRIINTHPSLLPKFGGAGFYGIHVHEAVLAAGESTTGASVHLVRGEYDTGPVIAQCELPVLAADTALSLQERVKSAEQSLLIDVLKRWAQGQIGNR